MQPKLTETFLADFFNARLLFFFSILSSPSADPCSSFLSHTVFFSSSPQRGQENFDGAAAEDDAGTGRERRLRGGEIWARRGRSIAAICLESTAGSEAVMALGQRQIGLPAVNKETAHMDDAAAVLG